MRLATWNVNSLPARLPRVLDWLEHTAPDVLCLQETKVNDAAFPHRELTALGYESQASGEGGYNGVAILSRVGIEDVARGFVGEPGFPDPERRAISATCGGVRVFSLYVPNGRELDSPHLAYKLQWLAALREVARGELQSGRDLVLCGDFNVAPTDQRRLGPGGLRRLHARERARGAARSRAWWISASPTCTRAP